MATVRTVLYKSKKLENGMYPVYIVVNHEGKRKHFSLGERFCGVEKDWDEKQQQFKQKRGNKVILELNNEILRQKQFIYDFISDYERRDEAWSLKMLENARNNKPTTALFSEVSQKYIDKIEKFGTHQNYFFMRKMMMNYYGEKEFNRLTCSDIDYKFINDYYNYLVDNEYKHATIKSIFKMTSAILNSAIADRLCSEETHPFIKKPNKKYFDMAKLNILKVHRTLPIHYTNQILNYNLYSNKDIVWQMFLFREEGEHLTYRNIMDLKHCDIKMYKDDDGVLRKGFKFILHKKNPKEMLCFLTPLMVRIIQDAKANHKCYKNHVFPIATGEVLTLAQRRAKFQGFSKMCKRAEQDLGLTGDEYTTTEGREKLQQVRFYKHFPKFAALLWCFSHYAQGMNLIDMARLKYSNIKSTYDDRGNIVEFIQYRRSKTNQDIIAPMTPQMKQIIKFFEENEHNYQRHGDYLLPLTNRVYSETDQDIYKYLMSVRGHVNTALKKIAEELEWEGDAKNISMYWSRHTYAQRCLLNGGSKEYIQAALGHREIKTTETYLEGFGVSHKHDFNKNLFKNDKIAN